jgi:hypothetical protein
MSIGTPQRLPAPTAGRRLRVDLSTVIATGLLGFLALMISYAILIFQQFSAFQVLAVGFLFLLVLVGLSGLLLRNDLRAVRLRPNALSVVLGIALAGALLITAFTWSLGQDPAWVPYYQPFPLLQLSQGNGFHQDAVFHSSLIQSILNFGYPSTGQNGVPFVPYHVLSHYADAFVLSITGLEPFDSYGLLFHFKITIFLAAIVVFVWAITREAGAIVFLVVFIVLTPVLLSTWIGVGSHALWLTSLILVLSAKLVFDALREPEGSRPQYITLFLIGVALGLGKVSSGLMFAVFVGMLALLRDYRRPRSYALIAGWLAFFAVYWTLFNTGHSSGLQRPTFRGTISFLNFTTTYTPGPIEWNLASLYILIALFAIFALVFRSRLMVRMLVAALAGVATLAAVTQTLAGLIQPDVYYFIYGLLVPALLLGSQALIAELRSARSPTPKVARSRAVVALLAALLVVATVPMFKPALSLGPAAPRAILDSLRAADTGYLEAYNSGSMAEDRISLRSILINQDRMEFDQSRASVADFRFALEEFMDERDLSPRNTLLFVPEEIYDSSVAELGGPAWARGMLIYAITGVPLLHGIDDDSIRNFGQSSYAEDALQRRLNDVSAAYACGFGKQVVVVRSWDDKRFGVLCTTP